MGERWKTIGKLTIMPSIVTKRPGHFKIQILKLEALWIRGMGRTHLGFNQLNGPSNETRPKVIQAWV